jgi:CelD/BcsL family acetyltransferase involved in cellulose biosynthesis
VIPLQSSTTKIECRLYTSFSDLEAHWAAWDEIAASAGAPIYMTFDWCRIWWEFYGHGRELAIFGVMADDTLAGVLPIYIDGSSFWPFKVRIARLVGATDGPTKVLDPPLRRDIAATALRLVVARLLRERSCDLVSLGPVSATSPSLEGLTANQAGESNRVRLRQTGVLAYYDLSGRPEDYLATLGRSEQKHRRYDIRYLDRQGAEEALVGGAGTDIELEFHAFARMHTTDWNVLGRPGHFYAWPRAYEFHLALTKCFFRLDRLRLHKIRVGQDVISYDYAYAFGPAFFWELRARSLDKRWAKISLGSCALIFLLRHAVRERAACLYAGIGSQEYKTRLGAKERPVVTIDISPDDRLTGAFVGGYRLAYRVLETLYFKLWYMRIQPRLPKYFHRPIWKFWSKISI